MRRLAYLVATAILITSIAAFGQSDKKKHPARSTAQNPAVQPAPRIPIPGVGGAMPPRKKPVTPPAQQPILPMVGPWQAGKQPANVLGPGQNPFLPGISGLSARPINDLIYGINVAWGENGTLARWNKDGGAKARRLAQLVKGSAATNVRIHIRWSDIERVRGKLEWADTDHFVRYVGSLGLPLVAVVDSAPTWTGARGDGPPGPAYYGDLAHFSLALAQRYRSHIRYWEFWNEPDRTTVAQAGAGGQPDVAANARLYADLLRVFSSAVRSADPTAQVAVGGLTTQTTAYLAGLYHAGAARFFDAVAFHSGSGTVREGVPFGWIDDCHTLMVHSGDLRKSLWITEWGWETAPNSPDAITELHQARLIRQSLAGMRDRSYITIACYDALNDWRSREADAASTVASGLAGYTMSPKAGFLAFREMATGANPEALSRYVRVNLIGALPATEEAGVLGTAINVDVDAGRPGAPLNPIWRDLAQGYEPAVPHLARELTPRLKQLGTRLVRFDPFPTGDAFRPTTGAVTVAAKQTPDLANIDWRYADSMVDAITRAGASPMIDLGTIPTSLSSPAGNPRMPRDLAEWRGFVETVVRHYNVEQKRGIFYWELSNEPDHGDFALSDWLRLYETFAGAVKSVDPAARVGGPATAGYNEEWLQALADHCARSGVPLQFLSWHAYDQSPAEFARQIMAARASLQQRPALKNVELIISEWNQSARALPSADGAQRAAFACSVIGHLAGFPSVRALYYEAREGPDPRRERAPLSDRWGLLTSDNVPKLTFELFRLLGRLDGSQLPADSEDTDVHALASSDHGHVGILLWRQAVSPSAINGGDLPVHLRVRGLPWQTATRGEQWTIASASSAQIPSGAKAGEPASAEFNAASGDVEIPVVLAPTAVAFLELQPARASHAAIAVNVQTPRYVVYGGTPFSLVATVRNMGSRAERLVADLNGEDLGVKGEKRSVIVSPGETRTVAFAVTPRAESVEQQRFVGVTVTPPGSGEILARSDVAVKVVAPLQARLDTSQADAVPAPAGSRGLPIAHFNALIENRSDAPARVGIIAGAVSSSVAAPAHQTVTVPIALTAASTQPGIDTQAVKIVRPDGGIITLPIVVAVPVDCRFAASAPRINGDLAEWAEVPRVALSPIIAQRRGSLSTLAAQTAAMWDREYLYLALVITDPQGGAPVPAAAVEPKPQIELTFENRGDDGTAQFAMDLDSIGERLVRLGSIGERSAGRVYGGRVAGRHEGSRTIYEVAIPWSQIPGGLRSRGSLRLGVLVHESHDRGRPDLSIGGADPSDPQSLVGLRLVGAGSARPADRAGSRDRRR